MLSLKNSAYDSPSVDSFFDNYLVSGDDSDLHYQEVHAIKKYLMMHGVEEEQIVSDPSGFDTYDSLRRAKNLY